MSSTVNTDKLLTFVVEKFETNELNNESLVQLVELRWLGNVRLNFRLITDFKSTKQI